MRFHSRSCVPLLVGALLLLSAPAAMAERGGGHGWSGRGYSGHGAGGHYAAGPGRGYGTPNRSFYNGGGRSYYAAPRYNGGFRGYVGGYYPGRFYSGRGYYYGGSFWARPYFGIGIGIPFGYGYATNQGCGYVDGWGYFHPAPCYSDSYSGY